MNCESCGMPMERPEDFGGRDIYCRYCVYCAPNGMLRSREQVREGWIKAVMRIEGMTMEDAADKVDNEMAKMPAWRVH
ncbi:MAG: zinc ribbon domain-containing protein [Candidatus Omnitrophota bacterium]